VEYTAMTYNIRMETEHDGPDQWKFRKEALVQKVMEVHPDFLGIQEGLKQQLYYMDENLEEYQFIGVGRDDGLEAGEFSALFYNAQKWKPVYERTFWLSQTPEKVSMGWDAVCNRVCTFGVFHNFQGDTLAVFNTHFDHIGIQARRESIRLILDSIQTYSDDYPALLMGDFNFTPTDSNYQLIVTEMNDSREIAETVTEPHPGTFNGFVLDEDYDRRIDYIFTNKEGVEIVNYASPDWRTNLRHVSDHYPVIIQFKID
jgi:endonuclease/exonuclease/phosphatase family metal-dependent hydrolase